MNLAAAAIRSSMPAATIVVADEEVVLDRRGYALMRRHRLLVVSDLHLEKGSSWARRRQFLPPYDSHDTLLRLEAAIEEHDPRMVICLGDSFHDPDGHVRLPDEMRDRLSRMAAGRDWCWIAGNHDPDPPGSLPGFAAVELAIGGIVFRHEPRAGSAPGEIAGHLHPGAVLRRHGRSLRRPCFATDATRLILPAFGAYAGTLSVRAEPFAQLFAVDRLRAYILGNEAIYLLAASQLG